MEEAIASSQIEGAVITRNETKEMLRKNKNPRNKSEQMILNNYLSIQITKAFVRAKNFELIWPKNRKYLVRKKLLLILRGNKIIKKIIHKIMITNQPQSGYFKTLSILFYALLVGQVMFLLIVTGLTLGGIVEGYEALTKIFSFAVPAFLIAAVFFSNKIYKRRLLEIAANHSIADKLAQYRGLSIIRFAIIEGGVLFAIIAFFITSSKPLGLMAAAGILFFIMLRPTKEKIIQDLQLSGVDIIKLDE